MLKHLYIKNYALIDELNLDFQEGFSVITGETGAGKSILLGAISLLLGQRADSKSIMEGADKCTVEATFSIQGYNLQSFFEANDFDYDDRECIVRREVTVAGKSRAFINDSPANLTQLRGLGTRLLDIHSQHQNLLLSDEDFQLNIIDIMSDIEADMRDYQKAFNNYRTAVHEFERAAAEAEQNRREEDYVRFQVEQLQELAPREGEDEELEEEQNALTHAEDIKKALYQAAQGLSNEMDGGALEALRQVKNIIHGLTRIYPKAEEMAERMENIYIEAKDICDEAEGLAEQMDFNPERLDEVNSRLDALYSLEQKHGVADAAGLCALLSRMEKQLADIVHADERLSELDKKARQALATAQAKAKAISAKRKASLPSIEQQITSTLTSLGVPNAKFCIHIEQLDKLSLNGQDRITFLFAANKNASPQPIAQVASGGEISRVMLALKAMTSDRMHLPTIIFDEIDTGVSGRIAESMALIMRQMSQGKGRQVLTITHLPQIAACGDHHFRVFKVDTDSSTHTRIVPLSQEERVNELAHLLSGSDVTNAAIENAKQLLTR